MVFTNGEQRIFYRTMLGVGLMIAQQLTGINVGKMMGTTLVDCLRHGLTLSHFCLS